MAGLERGAGRAGQGLALVLQAVQGKLTILGVSENRVRLCLGGPGCRHKEECSEGIP